MSTRLSCLAVAGVLGAAVAIIALHWAHLDVPIQSKQNDFPKAPLLKIQYRPIHLDKQDAPACQWQECSITASIAAPKTKSVKSASNDKDNHSDLFANMSEAHKSLMSHNDTSESIQKILSARARFVATKSNASNSITIEQKIANHLKISAPSPIFDIASLACRDSICEIQAHVYSDLPLDAWDKITDGIRTSFGNDFSEITSMNFEQNGQLVTVTYLLLHPTTAMGGITNP